MRRALVLAAALLVVLAAGAGGVNRPRPHRLYVVGDSVAHGTLAPLRRALPRRRISAYVPDGLSLDYGVKLLVRKRRVLPRVVHANLGTNTDPRILPPIRRKVERAIRAVGRDRCFVWATVYDRYYLPVLDWTKFNAMLRAEQRLHPNFFVFEWARYANAHRNLIGPDQLHPTAQGYRVRARLLATLLRRRCGL